MRDTSEHCSKQIAAVAGWCGYFSAKHRSRTALLSCSAVYLAICDRFDWKYCSVCLHDTHMSWSVIGWSTLQYISTAFIVVACWRGGSAWSIVKHIWREMTRDFQVMMVTILVRFRVGRGLAPARWAGWSGLLVGRHVKCWSRSNDLSPVTGEG